MKTGLTVVGLALAACGPDDPPETRQLDWQVASNAPEAKWLFPADDGRVCVASDAKFTTDGTRVSGGYVYCNGGSLDDWKVVVEDDGSTLSAFPSLAAFWAFSHMSGAVQLRGVSVQPLSAPLAGWIAYTGTGKQLVRATSSWEIVADDGTRRTLANAGGTDAFAGVGIGDSVVLGSPSTGLSIIEGEVRTTVLAPTPDDTEIIGQSSDGTVFSSSLDASGVMTFWKAHEGVVRQIPQPPYQLDHRHHQQCGVSRDGDLLCMMYFTEVFDEETGEGWLGHYELVLLSGTSWSRLGLGPPASDSVSYSFLVAADGRGHVFVKDSDQFGAVYGLAY